MDRCRIYAHRGANRVFPENTLPAFAEGLRQGADGIELDIRPCATGELAVFHDRDLFRLTGSPGLVANQSWDELRKFRVRGEPIPRLEEAIELVMRKEAVVNIEMKGDGPGKQAFADTLLGMLRDLKVPREMVVISTFSPVLHTLLRRANADYPIAFLSDVVNTGRRRSRIAEWVLGPDGVHPEDEMVTESLVRWAHSRGWFVNVWTVDSKERALELQKMGVDGLITNNVPALLDALRPANKKSA